MISWEDVKEKLGEICPYCKFWEGETGTCLATGTKIDDEIYWGEKRCEDFEYEDSDVECSIECKDCYKYKLGLCQGICP